MTPSSFDLPARSAQPRFGRIGAIIAIALVAVVVSIGMAQTPDATDLQVNDHPEIAAHLVGIDGRTLYVYAEDAPFTATCVDACAESWEPVRFEGLVPTATGLTPVLVGTIFRSDGTMQAAYAGMPLYTFVGDTEPGSILGLDGSGTWSAVAPDGTLISAIEAGAEETEAAVLTPEELLGLGQEVYGTYCAACHAPDGSGNAGPSIRSNARVADNAFVARQIRDGMSEMPGFGPILTNVQLAAVASYVRSSFGNDYPPMAPEEFER